MLKDSKPEHYSGAESKQGFDEEDSHPTQGRAHSDDEIDEELIPNTGVWGLEFEAMLRSALP